MRTCDTGLHPLLHLSSSAVLLRCQGTSILPHQRLCPALSRQQASLQSSSRALCGGQVPLHSFKELLQLRRPLVSLGCCSCRGLLLLRDRHQCRLVGMQLFCGHALHEKLVQGGEPGTAAAATASAGRVPGWEGMPHATSRSDRQQCSS